MKRYEIPKFDIVVEVNEETKCGQITSGLHDDEKGSEYDSAMHGIESLLLAMACEGIDISSPQIASCVSTAVESCENHMI